jgi:subtilisin family serine protease
VISKKLWAGIGAGTLTAALGVGVAAAVLPQAGDLPLRPLAVDGPALDDLEHVLVRVPPAAALVPVATAPAEPPTGAAPGLDLKKVDRYAGRIRRLERSGERVYAVLTDGTRVDVTVGAPADAPVAPAEPVDDRRVPAPLREVAADPDVTEVSQVDARTWRVVGDLSAAAIGKRTGLAAADDVLMHIEHTDDTYGSLLWALENDGGSVGGFPARDDADVDGVEALAKARGAGITVAVIDTGMQLNHPDLPALWQNTGETCGNGADDDQNGYVDDCAGWDFVHDDNTVYDTGDSNDHATHIAGTIAAVPDNNRGVAGLAPGVTIMPLKVSANGSMLLSDIAQAVRYAADNGARVINASFGNSPGSAPRGAVQVLEDAMRYARDRGVLVAAAAGNDGTNTDAAAVWPADLPLDNIVSVGASTADEKRAGFSNYGATTVDLFAPGHYIVSTVPGSSYGAMQGTSMATPHVAAAAAAVLGTNPAMTPDQVRERLMETVDPDAAYAGRSVTGGRLNADRAVEPSAVTDPAVLADGFDAFPADEEHTGTLTVSASAGLAPADARVTWRGSLLTAVGGTTYAVVDHPVTVDGKARATDAHGRVLLGPADGVTGDDATLTGDGVAVQVGTKLPAGDYALVVDVVSAADPRFAYGQSVAIFFTVPAAGGSDPGPDPADPGDGTDPAQPGTGPTSPADGTPDDGTDPAQPGDGTTQPGDGTTQPGDGTTPGDGTGPAQPGGPGQPTEPGDGTTEPGDGTTPGDGETPGGGATPGTPGSGTPPVPGPPAVPGATPRMPGTPVSTTVPGAPGSAAPTSPAPGPDEDVLPQPDPVSGDGITITSVTPDHGPAAGGTAMMIAGSGFPRYPVVTVGGRPAAVLSRGLASLTVATPGGDPGTTADVTVADRTDRSVTMPDAFRYDGTPVDEDDDAAPTTPPATGGPGDDATPEGPAGSTYRPTPALGSVTTRNGLRLAPILDGNPLGHITPAQWSMYRCTEPACRAVAVR